MGYDVTGPQVHADGEIWSRTNFNIRELLIEKYDDDYPADDQDLQTECAEGITPAHRCPGNRRWMQLVFDAMLLMPVEPDHAPGSRRRSGRRPDAVRRSEPEGAVARVRTRAAWACNAVRPPARHGPRPDAGLRARRHEAGDGARSGAESTDDDPVNARIFVGHYEARVSPIADTNPATFRARSTSTTRRSSHPGGTSSSRLHPDTDTFASASGSARASVRRSRSSSRDELGVLDVRRDGDRRRPGPTCRPGQPREPDRRHRGHRVDRGCRQLDGHGHAGRSGRQPLGGRQAGHDRPGRNRRVRVRYVQVSAHIGPGHSRFAALRQFELWACNSDEGAELLDAPQGSRRCTRARTTPSQAILRGPWHRT